MLTVPLRFVTTTRQRADDGAGLPSVSGVRFAQCFNIRKRFCVVRSPGH